MQQSNSGEDLYYIGIAAHYDANVERDGDKYVGLSYTPKNMDDFCDGYVEMRKRNRSSAGVFEHENDKQVGKILMFWRTNDNKLGVIGHISNSTPSGQELINNMKSGKQLGLSIGGLSVYDPITAKMKMKGIQHVGHVEDPLYGDGGTWIKEFANDAATIFTRFTSVYMHNAAYINPQDKSVLLNWNNTNNDKNNPKNLSIELSSYFGLSSLNKSSTTPSNTNYISGQASRITNTAEHKYPILFVTKYSANKYNSPVIKIDLNKIFTMSDNKNTNTSPLDSNNNNNATTVVSTTTSLQPAAPQQVQAAAIKDPNAMDVDNTISSDKSRNVKRKAEDQIPAGALEVQKIPIESEDRSVAIATNYISQTSGLSQDQVSSALIIAKKLKSGELGGIKSNDDLLELLNRGQKHREQEAAMKLKQEQEKIEQARKVKEQFAQLLDWVPEEQKTLNDIFNKTVPGPDDMNTLLMITTTANARALNTNQRLQQSRLDQMNGQNALKSIFNSSNAPNTDVTAHVLPQQQQQQQPINFFQNSQSSSLQQHQLNNGPSASFAQQQQQQSVKAQTGSVLDSIHATVKQHNNEISSRLFTDAISRMFYPEPTHRPPAQDILSGPINNMFNQYGDLASGIKTHQMAFDKYLRRGQDGFGSFSFSDGNNGTLAMRSLGDKGTPFANYSETIISGMPQI